MYGLPVTCPGSSESFLLGPAAFGVADPVKENPRETYGEGSGGGES